MKKTHLTISFIVLLFSLHTYGQEFKLKANQCHGKIFVSESETLEGIIELNGDDSSPWKNQEKVTFIDKDVFATGKVKRKDKKTFKPGDIIGFEFDGRKFFTKQFWGLGMVTIKIGKNLYFLEKIVDGKISVYNYFLTPAPVTTGSGSMEEEHKRCRVANFILEKDDLPLKGCQDVVILDYIADCDAVTEKYKNGGYGFTPVIQENKSKLAGMASKMVDSERINEIIIPLISDYNKYF
jgi:hypothetical protein